jgi:hypothetical protein
MMVVTPRWRQKWLVSLWIVSTVVGTTAWWATLASAATLLAQYAMS